VEQHLRLYRNHTPVCVFGYKKPIYDGDKTPDCSCPINATGKLRNVVNPDGSPKRILHRTLGAPNKPCKDWNEARVIMAQWLEWGQFERPTANLEGKNVTISQAVEYYKDWLTNTEHQSAHTRRKYKTFFNLRLLPWSNANKKFMMKDFDNPVTVKNFFVSWRNLQPERGKGTVLDSTVPLGRSTTGHELERYRTFLEFCRGNRWIDHNYAKAMQNGIRGIKLKASKVRPKFGFTLAEWDDRIVPTLDNLPNRYFKTDPSRTQRRKAFVHCLRFLGQRLSDTTMLGPHSILEENGNYFIALTQIKTGSVVAVPLDDEMLDMLRSLPIYGETKSPVVLERSDWTCTYGTKFWFWSANLPDGVSDEEKNRIVETAAKNWSDDISEILKRVEQQPLEPGSETKFRFEHPATPHTFRHTFAIQMMNAGQSLKQIADWMGDTVETVQTHYGHLNSDSRVQSHKNYMDAKAKMRRKSKAKVQPIRKIG
jgi:integrase